MTGRSLAGTVTGYRAGPVTRPVRFDPPDPEAWSGRARCLAVPALHKG